jgi:hypothetical protein
MAGLYGMKKIKAVDEKRILKYSKRCNIPSIDNYIIDTSYFSYLHSFDTAIYRVQIKNHYQPLQALYFDQSRTLCSFQINCYAGGFPNLVWDRNDIMTSFPPREQAPIDSILSFDKQISLLIPLSKTELFNQENFEYIVVVYWSKFMGRQSRRFIKIVQKNLQLGNDKKIKVIYANTDNAFAKTEN